MHFINRFSLNTQNYHFQISVLGLFLKSRKFSLDILIKYLIILYKKKCHYIINGFRRSSTPTYWSRCSNSQESGDRKRARKLTFLQSSGIKSTPARNSLFFFFYAVVYLVSSVEYIQPVPEKQHSRNSLDIRKCEVLLQFTPS